MPAEIGAALDVVDDADAVPEAISAAPLDRLPDAREAERLTGVDREVGVLPTQVLEGNVGTLPTQIEGDLALTRAGLMNLQPRVLGLGKVRVLKAAHHSARRIQKLVTEAVEGRLLPHGEKGSSRHGR